MELDEAIRSRQSIRHFSNRPVDFSLVTEIVEAGRHCPLAGNIQTIKYIIVSDKNLKEKLASAAGQEFIATAPWIIVVLSKIDQIKRSYEERADIYARQQAGAAIENMLLKVADLELATTWIGAFYDDKVKSVLHIPDNHNIEAMLPIAYPMGRTTKKPKQDLKLMTYFEQFGRPFSKMPYRPEAK